MKLTTLSFYSIIFHSIIFVIEAVILKKTLQCPGLEPYYRLVVNLLPSRIFLYNFAVLAQRFGKSQSNMTIK